VGNSSGYSGIYDCSKKDQPDLQRHLWKTYIQRKKDRSTISRNRSNVAGCRAHSFGGLIMKNKDKYSWLEERKDLFVKNVLRDFIRSYSFFMEIEKKYRDTGITYEGLDNWVGTQTDRGRLWILKDNCHRLWKDINPETQPESFFFDWMVGAIFHEAMKLKENVYMVDRYHPVYQAASTTSSAYDWQKNCRHFFGETMQDIQRGINRIQNLFVCAAEHLKSLLLAERDNSLLIRFMLEHKSITNKLWQKSGGLDKILEAMFPSGLEYAYCIAGENYLEGSWYEEARVAFIEALKINPDCKEAKYGLQILEKRLKELAHILEKEYNLANSNQVQTHSLAGSEAFTIHKAIYSSVDKTDNISRNSDQPGRYRKDKM
jgi:hypothetical protein